MHYIEVFLEDELDDSNLEIRVDTLYQDSSQVEGTLGIMVASLHGVKKYLTLNIVG